MIKSSLAMFLCFALCAVLFVSCEDPTTEFRKIEELERPFGISSGPPQDDKPQSFNIFIDGSSSMRGYTDPEGEYFATLKLLISRLPNDAEIKLYRFGSNSTQLVGDFRSNLNSILTSEYYSHGTTDICAPFGIINQDKGSINLIVTDGLDTSAGAAGSQVEFARSLRQFLGDKGYFCLMGDQAKFQGQYWSSKIKQYIDLGKDARRPFFCLALSNRRYADYIRNKIGSLFEETFDFGKLDGNDMRNSNGSGEEQKGFTHSEDVKGLPLSKFDLSESAKVLSFNQKDYLDSYGKTIDYRIAYKGFDEKDSLFTALENKKSPVSAEETTRNNEISFQIPFDLDVKGEYLIRVTFRKTLPQWIVDWSTDDDSLAENQTKAYMLKQWMQYVLENFGDLESLSTTQYYFQISKN